MSVLALGVTRVLLPCHSAQVALGFVEVVLCNLKRRIQVRRLLGDDPQRLFEFVLWWWSRRVGYGDAPWRGLLRRFERRRRLGQEAVGADFTYTRVPWLVTDAHNVADRARGPPELFL